MNALAESCSITRRSQLLRVQTAYHSSLGKASPPLVGRDQSAHRSCIAAYFLPVPVSCATWPDAVTALPLPSTPPNVDCAECVVEAPLHHRVWSTTVSCGPSVILRPVRLFATFPSNESTRV